MGTSRAHVGWLQASAVTLALCVSSGIAHVQAEEGAECAVTIPGSDGLYGDEHIAVLLWSKGVLDYPDGGREHRMPDGSLRIKLAWRRGVRGTPLSIEGHRLDADAPPLRSWIPPHDGDTGGQSTNLFFPTTGCWQVTGRLASTPLRLWCLSV